MNGNAAALLAVVALAFSASHGLAEFKPHGLFSYGGVLQQGTSLPVWGTADPGDTITVEFAGQKKTATTGPDGRWLIKLDPLKASADPSTMTLRSALDAKPSTVSNLVVGEVWVCSGQSNMAWPLSRTENAQAAIAASRDPLLRLWWSSGVPSDEPQRDVRDPWRECGPDSVASFSAVAYYFGRDLRKALNVPVGLMHAAVNGTPAEAWISHSALAAEPGVKGALQRHVARVQAYPGALAQHAAALSKHKEAVEKAKQEGKEPPAEPRAPVDPKRHRERPSACYHGLITPLVPYAMKGVLWYQGEGNLAFAYEYRTLLPLLIRMWRQAWGSGDFPFLIVQLAPCGALSSTPVESAWAELREAQLLTARTVTASGLVVITDCGAEADIHPPKKEPVGVRLALAARGMAYKEKVVYSGPVYQAMKVEGDKVVLSFEYTGAGLVANGGPLKGFTIAGEDRKFLNAQAEIKENHVIVWSPQVAKPVAVRFGWANYPVVNLYNKEGLPASPFRTDDFPMTTAPKGAPGS